MLLLLSQAKVKSTPSPRPKTWSSTKIDRRKKREYPKRGLTEKYLFLKKQFDSKYREGAKKYFLQAYKHMYELTVAKPGQAFSELKRLLGALPGDCTDSSTFSLPMHESESSSATGVAVC